MTEYLAPDFRLAKAIMFSRDIDNGLFVANGSGKWYRTQASVVVKANDLLYIKPKGNRKFVIAKMCTKQD